MGFVPDSNGSVKKSGCFNDFVGSIKRHKPMQKEKHKNELTVTVNKLFKRFDLLIIKFARLRLFQNDVKLPIRYCRRFMLRNAEKKCVNVMIMKVVLGKVVNKSKCGMQSSNFLMKWLRWPEKNRCRCRHSALFLRRGLSHLNLPMFRRQLTMSS